MLDVPPAVEQEFTAWLDRYISGWETEVARELAAEDQLAGNAFCPTGEGGGIDPTCPPGGGGGKGGRAAKGKAGKGKPPPAPASPPAHTHDSLAAYLYDRNSMPSVASYAARAPRGPAAEAAATKVVETLKTADRYASPTIGDVHAAAAPGMPIGEFHALLGKLRVEGKVRLEPFTRAVGDLKDPQNVMPADGEFMYFVTPVR